jgi:signal transduction histidine kinase
VPPASLVRSIVEQAKHLAALLDQVLSAHALLSPSEDEREEMPAGRVDLGKTVDALAFACQERAAARGVRIDTAAPQGAWLVAGEAGSVSLVLSQLVDNAVKFTRAGTEVRVRIAAHGDGRVRVLVQDEGPGVSAEDATRIFGEFDQGGGNYLVAKPTGLGLGLAIARRLARRLGGDVGVVPRGEHGATFWLELPLAREPVPAST